MQGKLSLTSGASIVVLNRLAVMGAGFGISIIAPAFLSAVEQGYFFTFLSLAALQGLFELGISALIIQHFAHIKGGIAPGTAAADDSFSARVTAVRKFSEAYFRKASYWFIGLVGTGGAAFFIYSQGTANLDLWLLPWSVLVLATSLTMLNITRFSMLEGFGMVREAYLIRTHATLILFGVFVAVLLTIGGLYAYPVALLLSQLYARQATARQLGSLVAINKDAVSEGALNFAEVKKTQRRFAVSAIAGYFTANSITPYSFHVFGPEIAGQVGLTTSMFFAAASLAMAFSTATAPLYGQWIAQNRYREVLTAWRRNVQYSILSALAMVGGLLIAVMLVTKFWPVYALKFLGVEAFIALALLVLANTTLTTVSTVLRSFKVEDLMWPSLLAAVISLALQGLARATPEQYFFGMALYNGAFFLPFAFVLMRNRLSVHQR